MGKKRKAPSLEEMLERPWCYYCERDFDDLKILISHQKAKHLKCALCPRRLGTAGGLGVHMQQVHKETLSAIENAEPGREDPNVEIFGMEGIPADVMQAHNEKVTQDFYASGGRSGMTNLANGESAAKKIKKDETPEELKKRLAEFKAKKAAEKAQGSAPGTPGAKSNTPQNGQVESQFQPPTASPSNVFNPAFGQPLAGSPVGPFNHPYGQPPGPFPPQFAPGPMVYGMPGPPQPGFPPFQGSPPTAGMPFPPQPFQHPPFPGPPLPSRGFSNGGPGFTHPPNHHNQSSSHSQENKSGPPRQNSLPAATGLPPRPKFDAPPVSRHQMHELHQGQKVQPTKTNHEASALSSGIDDLITQQQTATTNGHANGGSSEQNARNSPAIPQQEHRASINNGADRVKTATPEARKTPEKAEKAADSKSAKTKKKLHLVVKDHHTSPEEKMARMSRYSFTPRKTEVYRGPPDGAVARPARGYSDVAQSA